VRRVLDDRDGVRDQRIEVGRLAREVDGDDRLRPVRDQLGDAIGVDVEVGVAHVREDGRRARVDDDVGRRRPGDRGRDHLVARPHADREQREVERRRSGGHRQHVLGLDELREAPLELGRARSGRQPARAQRLGDRLDLLVADRRRLETEHRGSLLRRDSLHRP
jgi:hypothetical protein